MGTDDSKSRARFSSSLGFELALRQGRCLSFSDLLRLRLANGFVVDSAASNLNSAYLRLHGDDVYFSLEDFGFGLGDGAQAQARRKDSHSMELELISCLST
ncbi:hypothetical protein Scep_003867 [Stephania cephalantha]|uniref:Uncharacterized protein n=1 Tax=Stephania cephalantha TaxID=152367 RepID=A0AAP0KST2_9MAGN